MLVRIYLKNISVLTAKKKANQACQTYPYFFHNLKSSKNYNHERLWILGFCIDLYFIPSILIFIKSLIFSF
jgi:hypothetical protein